MEAVLGFGVVVRDGCDLTAAAANWSAWVPIFLSLAPVTELIWTWYGEPPMLTAELLFPQSARVATWPPKAMTAFPAFGPERKPAVLPVQLTRTLVVQL